MELSLPPHERTRRRTARVGLGLVIAGTVMMAPFGEHGGLRSVRSITFSFDRFDRFGRFGFFPFVFRFFVKISNFNWPGLGPGRLGRTGRLGRAPALAN